MPLPKNHNRCDKDVLDVITEFGCDVHKKCAGKQKRKHPVEMKGSRIKRILPSICRKKVVEKDPIIWNNKLEDDKEYTVCSSFCDRIKKEEKALAEEEERKRKREEKEKPLPER